MAHFILALVASLLAEPTVAAPPASVPESASVPVIATLGRVAGTVTVLRGSATGKPIADRSGVVFYLELPSDHDDIDIDDEPDPDQVHPVHVIRQVNKTFTPAVSAVLRGTEVQFPNDDMIFHNVFSLSRTQRFDLGLYKSGSSKSILLRRTGIIDVYCNIHPDMAAKILVLDNPYFAITDAEGHFTIADVPPGTYPYVAWLARGEAVHGQITITPGATTQVPVTLIETGQAHAHTRKDGTPYGRYH